MFVAKIEDYEKYAKTLFNELVRWSYLLPSELTIPEQDHRK